MDTGGEGKTPNRDILATLYLVVIPSFPSFTPLLHPPPPSFHPSPPSSPLPFPFHLLFFFFPLSPHILLPSQGHHSRSRPIPRTVHVTPSSAGSFHGSHTHLNGHAENGGSKSSGTYMYDSKKRLQPIGADAKPKTSETTRLNGYVKRTSLVMDGTNLKGSHSSLTLSASQESHKSSSSSTADQAISDTQFLPPIV